MFVGNGVFFKGIVVFFVINYCFYYSIEILFRSNVEILIYFLVVVGGMI